MRAAAPSCGGISDRQEDNLLSDDVYLKKISCPIMFLSPANDFHGRINDLQTAVTEIKSKAWRATCSAHHNHQDTAVYEVATQIWFDQYLKGTFVCPQTPQTELSLSNGIPVFTVRPDSSKNIRSVDIYYTQQGQVDGLKDNRENTKARFWHRATPGESGQALVAELPIHSLDKPLWFMPTSSMRWMNQSPVPGIITERIQPISLTSLR
ncbi:hypothetical protein P4E94_04360 [Pontiellaceae bacterium B12219]|nr:hypothetical protein [Pontiellaceae bacterium B12219]